MSGAGIKSNCNMFICRIALYDCNSDMTNTLTKTFNMKNMKTLEVKILKWLTKHTKDFELFAIVDIQEANSDFRKCYDYVYSHSKKEWMKL